MHDRFMHVHWDGQDGPRLIAGDAGDLPAIRALLAELPSDAYGQVFVEIFGPIQLERLDVPSGMNVTWLCRDTRRSDERIGAGASKGEALVRAIEAWLDEWVRVEPDGRSNAMLWIGCHANPRVNRLCRSIAAP
ncbi:MAG TPA: SIP domain-containing protein [Plantibacter sp.]|uniref:SIP domain-containing protein n=1 Tax=unclassified Plantibacter TaxID=2624265 RepID=UPI002BB0FCFA|nr:SIP domain-containing protein [Plantibacter sp.]